MAGKRAGGRAARRAMRAAPLAEKDKAVHPGQRGGRFLPLTDQDIQGIHEAILDLLENVGFSRAIPSCVKSVVAAGGKYTDDGRLLFPRDLVLRSLEVAARDITLFAQDEKYDLDLSEKRVYFGTAGAAVHVVDDWKRHESCPEEGAYRESTLQDLYDAARLVDSLDHIHFFQRCMVPRDIEPADAMDLNTAYVSVSGTCKHVGTSFISAKNLRRGVELFHEIAGSEKAWRERPFVSLSSCFVVPPLRFAEDACSVLEAGVQAGMPVLLLAAGQAGATSPATLAGAVVQEMAEVLGALVYVNAIVPGHPCIAGPWPFVSDLRTGSMSGGSGEQAILMAACGQMGSYYGLPTGIAAGMADSKIPDAQSGYEKGYTLSLAGHSGANLVYEAAGMQASLLGFSFEGCCIDNDMLGAINRSIRGIEVDKETLALEAIEEVCCHGPEHFLGHHSTLSRMLKDYVYPEVGNRYPPALWKERGADPVNQAARERAQAILSSHFPGHINEPLDSRIRSLFDIRLSRAQMKPSILA